MKLIKILMLLTVLKASNLLASTIYEADKLFEKGQFEPAYDLYLEFAELGNPYAYYQLGRMHVQGLGVEQDLADGILYYVLAAEYNYLNADKIVAKALNSLSLKEKANLEAALVEAKQEYGKAVVNQMLFPILNDGVETDDVIYTGKDNSKYYSSLIYSSIGGDTEESLFVVSRKIPYLILDIDVAKDGSIRHHEVVQKIGDPIAAQSLLRKFLLQPFG